MRPLLNCAAGSSKKVLEFGGNVKYILIINVVILTVLLHVLMTVLFLKRILFL